MKLKQVSVYAACVSTANICSQHTWVEFRPSQSETSQLHRAQIFMFNMLANDENNNTMYVWLFVHPEKCCVRGPKVCEVCEVAAVTHVLVVLQEDVEVEVFSEDRMSRHATQEDLVHGDGLLEDGQVLSEWRHTSVRGRNSLRWTSSWVC